MRKRQNKVLIVMVQHRKGEIVLMVLSINWIAREVLQRVVHPAHVPFEREAKTSKVWGACDQRPSRGFLSNGHDSGIFHVNDMVKVLEKLHRFEIFAASILIGNPFTLLARVIEI